MRVNDLIRELQKLTYKGDLLEVFVHGEKVIGILAEDHPTVIHLETEDSCAGD